MAPVSCGVRCKRLWRVEKKPVLLSRLDQVGGRLLVTVSCFETVKAVMSPSNWRFGQLAAVLDGGVVAQGGRRAAGIVGLIAAKAAGYGPSPEPALGKMTEAPDPAHAFREASLVGQRAVIESLCTVRPRRQPRGRMRSGLDGLAVFDTSTVVIDWRC